MEPVEKYITDLTPDDWASMGLKYRLWNYIKLVEYIYHQQTKKSFKYEINDKIAIGRIIEILEDGNEGILLLGEVGCGKTFLMKMLQKVMIPKYRYRILNTVDVVTDFKVDGEEALSKYTGNKIFFDDLGFEKPGVHFGDKVDCIDYLTYKRYEEFTGEEKVITMFATNLSGDQLEKRYDKRTIDRIKGMCHTVVMKGKSQRLSRISGIVMPHIFPIMYGQPKPNPPKFTIGPTKSKPLGQEVKDRMDQIYGVPDHENQRTVKIGAVINKINETK